MRVREVSFLFLVGLIIAYSWYLAWQDIMRLSKLLVHELSLVLIVKFFLLYLLWLLFFSYPNPADDEKQVTQHIFGETWNMPASDSVYVKE